MRRLLTIPAFALLVTGLGILPGDSVPEASARPRLLQRQRGQCYPIANPCVLVFPSASAPAPALAPGEPLSRGERSRGLGDDKPTRRALLVGVTKYEHLADRFQLEGPGNDVVLMKTMLVKEFAVPEANIVTLSEADGAKDAKLLPTRKNIEREFKYLAEVTRPGDEVIILLGGHGSQQPESPNAKEPEIDGLDEIFLPRDVGKWNNGVGSVEKAIIDDELGEWLTPLWEKNKAFVWLVIDACHSGTMMRGGDDVEKPRKAEPMDLGVPKKAIADAEDRGAKRNAAEGKSRGEVAKPTSIGLGGKPGVFAIYAAQPTETTPERPLPIGDKNAKSHGILTYTICQTLTQAKAANSPISYRELGHRIQQQYSAWGRTSPTPMVEFPGADPDREVLGPGVWKDRSNILIADLGGTYAVNAGQLVGLTSGSVLQVLPPAGMGDEPVGHVKVTSPRMIDADVTPCAFNNMPAPKKLQHGSRCKIAYIDFGDVQLRVAVPKAYPSTDKDRQEIPAKVRDPLVAKLKELTTPNSLFRYVEDVKDAAWVLTPWSDGKVSLMPATGLVPGKDEAKSRGYGPGPLDKPAEMEEWLNDVLGKIARVEGLITLASSGTNDLLSAGDLAPKMKIEISRIDPKTKQEISMPWPATDLTFYANDAAQDGIRLKVTNVGRASFDLTVLDLDSEHAIDVFFPRQVGTINTIEAGKPVTIGLTANKKCLGTEHVAFVAVKSLGGTGTNFVSLKQKGPERLKDLGARGVGLAKVLARQVYKTNDKDSTRGATVDEVQDTAMALVTWKVKGELRPGTEAPRK